MSPAQASSASDLSEARKSTGFDAVITFFDRTCVSFIPRLKCPDARRTKATRSRCFGSILACTLNTNPDTSFSKGFIDLGTADCICGDGPKLAIPFINSCTPKLFIADPNQMGVRCPSNNDFGLRGGSSSFAISTSSINFFFSSVGMCLSISGSLSPLILILSPTRFLSTLSINSSRSWIRS